MKLKLTLIAAFVAATALTACGGGDSGSSSGGTTVSSPAALTKNDTVPGTGAVAATGTIPTIKYTGWLYNSAAADFKGAQFDSGTINANGAASSPLFRLGATSGPTLITGFDQGMIGMKVGGKRTLLIPSSMGYGSSGYASIPPNSGLVFEVELTAVN
ncbi:MAG: FKBP-type peptidyl-prolyl cis-trans isomerase [Pseudomonadota bacterium]